MRQYHPQCMMVQVSEHDTCLVFCTASKQLPHASKVQVHVLVTCCCTVSYNTQCWVVESRSIVARDGSSCIVYMFTQCTVLLAAEVTNQSYPHRWDHLVQSTVAYYLVCLSVSFQIYISDSTISPSYGVEEHLRCACDREA